VKISPYSEGGFSIAETAVATLVIALFLGSMFALNSACLGLVRSSKDSAAAMLSNQERVEQMRSCNWSEVTDNAYWTDSNNASYYLSNIMNTATQTGAALANASEVVRVTENGFLQGASAAYFQVTRTPSGVSVTAQNNPVTLVTARMLKVDITLNWTALGGRQRTRSSTTIIARGGLTINETTTIAPTVRW
jgi:Tfp pilus assembly protein PilV